jgi:GTP cyclohydrolase I/GTP cyclohydrolase-4
MEPASGSAELTIPSGSRDVQASRPSTQVSLTRVGVRGVEKVIHVRNGGGGNLYFAELACFVDLNPRQAGVHMSRFEEIVNEAIDEVVLSETLRAEELAARIATQVRERQDGLRAEVRIEARYPETVNAPISGISSQEIYKLHGVAVASERGTRTITGVEAQGMTACPCAQEELTGRARERLEADGFDPGEIERIFGAVPVATHNQRGIGQLHLGTPEGVELEIDAPDLLHIVEQSMSSEIYELMKRTDEASVVEKAHRNPRFVEDVVREMVRRVAEAYPGLRNGGYLLARQENLETIHRHTVVAERSGMVAEVLQEIETGEHSKRHVSEREWLEEPCADGA